MLWRRGDELATVRIDPCNPSPEFLRDCFAEILASLDERPRRLRVDVHAGSESRSETVLTMVDGNPAFIIDGNGVTCANFRRRWIAEHPVPLVFSQDRTTRLVMIPTTGNRVKVRRRMF
jgi:hypothetical protein